MNWLLWKDYRENRLVVFTAAGLLLVPHLIALGAACVQYFRWHESPGLWVQDFMVSSMYSLIISQLAIALIGGNAIAGERADRSAEFLASLPITRGRVIASKLLLSLAIVGVIWIADLSALLCLSTVLPRFGVRFDGIFEAVGATAIVAVMFFGVAWLLSSFLRSPTFSVAGALLAPLLLWTGIVFVCYLFQISDEKYMRTIAYSYFGLCLALAPVCFAVGTWYYLRRIEP